MIYTTKRQIACQIDEIKLEFIHFAASCNLSLLQRSMFNLYKLMLFFYAYRLYISLTKKIKNER
jgi:hypothetical protein